MDIRRFPMLQCKCRLVGPGFALIALIASVAIATSPGTLPRAAAADAKDTKVKALLKERHATLQAIASQTTQAYQAGKASFVQVAEANRAAHNAELALCDTAKERVAVLGRMLAEAKVYEKSAEQEYKAGTTTATDALKAKADRLEVEIALERARAK